MRSLRLVRSHPETSGQHLPAREYPCLKILAGILRTIFILASVKVHLHGYFILKPCKVHAHEKFKHFLFC